MKYLWSLQDWVQIFGKGRLKVSWFLGVMGRVKKELIPSLIQFYYAHYSRNFNTWLHCWMTLVEFFTSCLREGSSVLWTEIWFFFIFASSSVLILCFHLLFQPAIFLALFSFLASFCTSLCFFVMELILHSYTVSCLLGLLWSAFWLSPSRYVIFWDNSGWKTTVRLSSPISCSEQGHFKQVAEDHIQLGFEYLQGCRLQNFFYTPVTMFHHLMKDIFFIYNLNFQCCSFFVLDISLPFQE